MPGFSSRPEQVIGIVEMEGEAEQRRDRRERDVALVPGQADAEGLLAVDHLLDDDADVAHARRIRAGMRAGEREARHFLPGREAVEVLLLLRRRAVLFEQLARPERVGHHDRDAGRDRAARDLGDDHATAPGRKSRGRRAPWR